MGQECILLTLVEPVHLIDKDDGALRLQALKRLICFFDSLANVFDAAQHRADANKLRIKRIGHESGNGGLAHARRAPQNTTVRLSRLKGQTQRQTFTQQVLLANHLTQASGA